jgi:O-antigen/teichoic acid export membrane protein
MKRNNAIVFLTGRLLALVVLLGFQLGLVRLLGAADYGRYALILAWATLMQSVISFGVPRLIPKYVSQAGWSLSNVTVRKLIGAILVFRIGVSAIVLLVGYLGASALGWTGDETPALLAAGGAYILVSLTQVDSDAMAQSLGLQLASRRWTVGEAIVRLALVFGAAAAGQVTSAASVLAICAATAGLASVLMLRDIATALARPDTPDASPRALDRREFRGIAISGYASAMAWFATSPAVVRLLAVRVLATAAFAGFAFVQTLVLSFQRYTPGMMLFPFVEPMVMKHHARTGDTGRLEAALALVTKVDLVLIGAAVVGTAVAGAPLVELLTGGRYGAAAWALPWLLVYILASSVFRAFEIVAIALGAGAALTRTLALSLVWLAVAVGLSPRFGLIVLLAVPVADSLSRLALMWDALRRFGIRRVVDAPIMLGVTLLAGGCIGAGQMLIAALRVGGAEQIAIGIAAGVVYLGGIVALRPLRQREIAVMGENVGTGLLGRVHKYARA